jgi:hypothetical protein
VPLLFEPRLFFLLLSLGLFVPLRFEP